MNSILQKNQLKSGYYYSGYVMQHACCIADEQQKIVGMWDVNENCFWFWEFEETKKTKRKLLHLCDIDNEIQEGFIPLKEIIPKQDYIIE